MSDYVKSGVGGEVTDQSFISVGSARPLWRLKPLPLAQVNPDLTPTRQRGPANSLQSACLTVISHHFHNYRHDSLRTLPNHLVQRVMARVNSDRKYGDSALSRRRPDEATMWAFHALADPESAPQHHTLVLPADMTMAHLPRSTTIVDEPDHPLNALPRLFGHDFALLTSLTLSGGNGAVNDTSVQALKWCTHLTALWMRGCTKVSDDGIRLLASSVSLPSEVEGGRGMWRLRAWWLRGCIQVSDKSMKSFAKWPGLSLLDLRDTSCTEVSIGLFNRTSQAVFAGQQPDFQPCTEGLLQLFAAQASPTTMLNNLSLTLIEPDLDGRQYLAFHLLTGTEEPKDEWLHEPLPRRVYKTSEASNKGKFVSGVGWVYGKGAEAITNDDQERREKLKWALRFEAHADDVERAEAEGRKAPMSWWDKEAAERKRESKHRWEKRSKEGWNAHLYKADHRISRVFDEGSAPAFRADAKEVGLRLDDGEEAEEVVRGDTRLMLVRMVCPQWKELSWHREVAKPEAVVKVARRARVTNDIADLLGVVSQSSYPTSSSQVPSSSPPSSSPPSDRLATPSSSPASSQTRRWPSSGSQPKASPFASQRPTPSGLGKRNPFASGSAPKAKQAKVEATQSQADPLAFITRQVKPLAVEKPRSDPLDFTANKKRAWGSLGQEEVKKKSMKLFSKE